jgi:hypothetical protein
MLAGTRGLRERATEDAFAAQWRDDVVGPELVRLGVEEPEQLGATFLADAQQLAPWIAGSARWRTTTRTGCLRVVPIRRGRTSSSAGWR